MTWTLVPFDYLADVVTSAGIGLLTNFKGC